MSFGHLIGQPASLAFGFAHYFNPDATARACLWIALEAGVLLGGAYMLTRSLWLPTGLHAAWNFTQGAVFGVPVSGSPATGLVRATLSGPELLSGGGFGLEASVIALVIATAAGIWFQCGRAASNCVQPEVQEPNPGQDQFPDR